MNETVTNRIYPVDQPCEQAREFPSVSTNASFSRWSSVKLAPLSLYRWSRSVEIKKSPKTVLCIHLNKHEFYGQLQFRNYLSQLFRRYSMSQNCLLFLWFCWTMKNSHPAAGDRFCFYLQNMENSFTCSISYGAIVQLILTIFPKHCFCGSCNGRGSRRTCGYCSSRRNVCIKLYKCEKSQIHRLR